MSWICGKHGICPDSQRECEECKHFSGNNEVHWTDDKSVLLVVKELQAEIERLKERVPKKGEWLQTDKPDITAAWHPHCSVCGKEVTNNYAFCPFCGTDMRKQL